jgi:uncharacterized metal-binding protein YceD (DUF177 family)
VKKFADYIIPFSGLKAGEHSFTYQINNLFFEKFDNFDIHDIDLNVTIKMIKSHRLLEFYCFFKGIVTVACDRCLDLLKIPVDTNSKLIVKLEDVEEFDDDIVYLKPDEYEFDISDFVYENIIFSLPSRKVHNEEDCNPEMIKKLEHLIVKNNTHDPDPRWNQLKNLLN